MNQVISKYLHCNLPRHERECHHTEITLLSKVDTKFFIEYI